MALEVEESKEWCKCEWIIHPDDVNISAGMCRKCGLTHDHHVHKENDSSGHAHQFT